MHKEPGERRDFPPTLIAFLDRVGVESIVVEEGYGSGMGVDPGSYLEGTPRCRLGSYDECFQQDVVVVLRYPSEATLERMRPGSILVSMVHFPTRPDRIAKLTALGLRAVSLDSVVDDHDNRLVENLAAVGWNGVQHGFRALHRVWPALEDPLRPAMRALILGAGAVGAHAVRATAAWGDRKWRSEQVARGVRGVEITVVDYDLSSDERYMRALLARSDMLIDATQRRDASKPVVPNAWLGALPSHAVMIDLSADPYDFSRTPPLVKGLEGVPAGNLDKFVFDPDDPAYDELDRRVDTTHRRVALSCYSWPGVDPLGCMETYSKQIEPLLRVLLERDLETLDPDQGPFFDRAVARAELRRWKENHPH